MNIGQAASASGVTAKMIRYYESIDLVEAAGRTDSGYRIYGDADVHVLRFIRQARTLGFPIEQIRQLLSLWLDQDRASAEVKTIAAHHISELNTRIAELVVMRDTLANLSRHCAGDKRPGCPILDGISGPDVRQGLNLKGNPATRSAVFAV
ncbi:Cu(I)-responsive transcriptional regulator [Caballeronia mineralivorans]|jgi:Cu(I)-responsive transcriptional regulator|uniref:Cu(I)-responsive transcriptional regulator n=1 Tax=Caballeronia mineralivorans TaxID=2010198 RepID=UPI0023F3391E|nr:Cu(I)-responsive transcriptional regulator [Caballeronia mineralivorans]MDB5789863.1 cueR [Caballeronia mineralivorans]MEA3096176.1 MerR family transcriptional regulator, copper efflux regulator [Caballeronia mineralivorans]